MIKVRNILIFLFIFVSNFILSQEDIVTDNVYDFDTIPLGKEIFFEFKFKNTGNNTTKIVSIETNAHMNKIDIQNDNILPNGWGVLRFKIKPTKKGKIEKVVTIKTNNTQIEILLRGYIK